MIELLFSIDVVLEMKHTGHSERVWRLIYIGKWRLICVYFTRQLGVRDYFVWNEWLTNGNKMLRVAGARQKRHDDLFGEEIVQIKIQHPCFHLLLHSVPTCAEKTSVFNQNETCIFSCISKNITIFFDFSSWVNWIYIGANNCNTSLQIQSFKRNIWDDYNISAYRWEYLVSIED